MNANFTRLTCRFANLEARLPGSRLYGKPINFNSSILQFFNSSILQFFNSSILQFFNLNICQVRPRNVSFHTTNVIYSSSSSTLR